MNESLDQEFASKLAEFTEQKDDTIFTKTSLRKAFGAGLIKAAQRDRNVVALSADLADSVGFGGFREQLPDNYVEVGIAEQNLVGVAAGLAHVGLKPFAASYAAFNPGRNYEQIRTMIALNDLPVVVVGSHAGLNVGPDGATHQMLEDVALMRALPNMNVFAPASSNEAFVLAQFLASFNHPAYVRLPRESQPEIFRESTKFTFDRPTILREGSDVTIVGYGTMTSQNLLAAAILERDHIESRVVHYGQLDINNLSVLMQNSIVVATEEHEKRGGFGEEIATRLLENGWFGKFVHLAVNGEFGQSGTADELAKSYHLTADDIACRIRKLVS